MNTKKSRDVGNFISHAEKQSEQNNVWQQRNDTTDYAPMDEYPELSRSTPPGPNNNNNSYVPAKDQVNSKTSPRAWGHVGELFNDDSKYSCNSKCRTDKKIPVQNIINKTF